MEDWVHVHKTVPTQLDHFTAAVSLDIVYLDMPAMVRLFLKSTNVGNRNHIQQGF